MAQQRNPLDLSEEFRGQPGEQSDIGPLDRWLVRLLLAVTGNPPITVTLWGNSEKLHGDRVDSGAAVANLVIHDRKTLVRLLTLADLGFGDAYSSGGLEVEGDLAEFLQVVYWSRKALSGLPRWLSRAVEAVPRPRGTSLREARANIQHHYDLGNDFYQLWLDEEMVYTCAYFDRPDVSLEQAQISKMEHVCRKLRLQPGQRVVEAGCGWGSLARYMARQHGARVRAFNISREQIEYARWKAKSLGLGDTVEYIEDDYRNLSGRYDAFVSVGMLEHVGVPYYRELGEVIRRCLEPQGLGLIHNIGRNRPKPNSPWTERRIFPGSYPPSLSQMMDIFEPWELSVLDVENLRLHYARTLEHWTERFEQQEDRIQQRYGPAFVRAWRLYLVASTVAFRTGSLQLFQVLFSPDSNNMVPLTREHLYQ